MFVVTMLPPLSPVSMLATPSMVMLFEFGRWPFTVKPLTCEISVLPLFWDRAPGTSVAKLKSNRPLFAMFVNVSFDSVNARSPLTDCSGVGLETITCSVSPPISSVNSPVEILSFAFTTMFVRCSVLKPCSETSSV